MDPKVIIASPVSYKILKGEPFFTGVEWLHSALSQDYNPLAIYVLANGLQPEMLEQMKAIKNPKLTIKNVDFGYDPDVRKDRRKTDKTYIKFAKIRNTVLDFALATEADYMVSIDSDIIVHPDCVYRLVSKIQDKHKYAMIGAIVNNTRRVNQNNKYPHATYNFGILTDTPRRELAKGEKPPKYTYTKTRFNRGAFIDVGYTGACAIIDLNIFRKHQEIRWGERLYGEDLFLCERIREAGYKIGVDTSIVTLHMMDDIVWKGDVGAFMKLQIV